MKKFLSIFILALCAAPLFTSCHDDSDYEVTETVDGGSPLRIISRQTSFDAPGGQGKVEIECDAPYTVETTDQTDWVTTTTEGNIITLNVAPNEELDGRTCMLAIKSGKYQTRVAVIQAGQFFEIEGPASVSQNNTAKTYTYTLNTNAAGTLEAYAFEYTAAGFAPSNDFALTMTETGFTMKVGANKTGHVRQGIIVYTYGDFEGVIPITQFDFAQDIAGEYRLLYNKSATATALYYQNAEFKKSGSNYYLSLQYQYNGAPAPQELKIPVTFDDENLSITIACGAYCGDVEFNDATHKVHMCFLSTDGYITWVAPYTFPAPIDHGFMANGNYLYSAKFEDNGSWGGKVINGLAIEMFTGTPASSTNREKIRMYTMYNPILQRVVEAPAAKTASFAPSTGNGDVIPERIYDLLMSNDRVMQMKSASTIDIEAPMLVTDYDVDSSTARM